MKDLSDGLTIIFMIVWICAGIRVAYKGYLIQMTGGTMNNTHSVLNVDIDKVENFSGGQVK